MVEDHRNTLMRSIDEELESEFRKNLHSPRHQPTWTQGQMIVVRIMGNLPYQTMMLLIVFPLVNLFIWVSFIGIQMEKQ